MQRSINLTLTLGGVAALALANTPCLPAAAQEADTAGDLGGVMSISLADVVKPNIGFQGALQGAGTPNQAGIGGFLPLSVGENSVWFLDALVNANFADREGESSIINTDVDGEFSTSTLTVLAIQLRSCMQYYLSYGNPSLNLQSKRGFQADGRTPCHCGKSSTH